MCGITGAVWSRPEQTVDQETLRAMTEVIRHRGPNESGAHIESIRKDAAGKIPGVALGFRRLSIIDIQGAQQPLANEDRSKWMVFNGEIYNFVSLRNRLQGKGHRFATHGDGESILHLYEDLGTDCFSHLNGMFAVAIWDATRRQLVLARDRVGQKPLYYTVQSDRILFGSELKCLMEVPGVRREVDPAAIDEFLTYQYVPHPNTIWKNIRKVPPGHFVTYRDGRIDVQRYWHLDVPRNPSITKPDAIEQLRELMTDSIRLRMQSDVPLGAFLSGGVDSSLIVALAQQLRQSPIQTFSIGFPDKGFDETAHAQRVADFVGTQHTCFEVVPQGVDIIDSLAWHYDEPFGDSSAIPTWYLSSLTRGEVTVALSGDGGDELFAGYNRYRALWISQWIQRLFPLRRVPGVGLLDWLPHSSRDRSILRRAKRLLEVTEQTPPHRYMNWLQIFPESLRAKLYNDAFVESLPDQDPFDFFNSVWDRTPGRDLVTRASMSDLFSYLPCDLMTKVDIASMAHGLEVRQPMLDYRVIELAASLPVGMKFRGRRGKLILRDTFNPLIPKSIWTRPKMGFGVPIANWFRNELKPMLHDLLLVPDARCNAFFCANELRRLVETHQQGRKNHQYRLWSLLVLEKWLRRWL